MNSPYYDQIITILQTAKIDVSNVVVDILRENSRLQNMVDTMAEEMEKRPDPAYVAKLERLVELLTPEILLLEAHRDTVVERFREIPEVYRDLCDLRPKE